MPSEALFTAPHAECSEPYLWSAPDDAGSELEVSDFISALTRLLKPRLIVETGTWHGATTSLLADALRHNGRGHVFGIELDAAAASVARDVICGLELQDWATVVPASSLRWTPPGPIDLTFLDAGGGWHRIREFQRLRAWMHPGTVVCVHDTARKNVMPRLGLEAVAAQGLLSPVWIRSPRGLLMAQPRWPHPLRRIAGTPKYATIRGYTTLRAAGGRARRALRR